MMTWLILRVSGYMLILWCWEQLSIKCWRYKIQCIQKGNLIVLCSMQKLHQICPIQWGHIKRVKDTSIITSRHRNDCNNWTPDQVIAFIGEDRTGIVVYWNLIGILPQSDSVAQCPMCFWIIVCMHLYTDDFYGYCKYQNPSKRFSESDFRTIPWNHHFVEKRFNNVSRSCL